MFGKKKNRFAKDFPPAPRKREDIDRDYRDHALQHGHKARLIAQLRKQMGQLQEEITGHLAELEKLNEEGMKLPPEAAPAPAVPAQDGAK